MNGRAGRVDCLAWIVGFVVANAACGQCQPEWLPQPGNAALNGAVRAVGAYQDELVVGGTFTQASGRVANRVARWSGNQWSALGGGVNGAVNALEEFDGALIAAGEFTSAGGQPANRVAQWNGSMWNSMGLGLGPVFDLAVYGDEVVAATSVVRRWDGSSWSPLGSGVDFIAVTLAVHERYLYAGGHKIIGFESIARVARWNGQGWIDLPTVPTNGVGHLVTKLGVHDGTLYAGGHNTAGSVHGWNGTNWYPIGSGILWFDVLAIGSYRGELIAAGDAPLGGQGLARWNGSAWTNLGLGLNATVNALFVHDGMLIAGGSFTTAGGLPSPYWARYGCLCQADCNNSGSLTIADFGCFQSQYVLAHPYADCNADGNLTVGDFGCFQGKYVLGCP